MGNLKAGKINAPSFATGGSATNCESLPKSKTGAFKTPPVLPGGKQPDAGSTKTICSEDQSAPKTFKPEEVSVPTPHSFKR